MFCAERDKDKLGLLFQNWHCDYYSSFIHNARRTIFFTAYLELKPPVPECTGGFIMPSYKEHGALVDRHLLKRDVQK